MKLNQASPSIIVGIDPGSRITGYGVIARQGTELHYVASGCIKVKDKMLGERLQIINASIGEILASFKPNEAAIEEIFIHRNPNSALKLGQARGAAIVALAQFGLSIAEYSTRLIKQAVVGYGGASKEQIQHMVRILLKLPGVPQADAADALAVAICHANCKELSV